MARIVTCGFEAGLISYEPDFYSGAGVSTSSPRTGTYNYRSGSGNYVAWWCNRAASQLAEFYGGFGYKNDQTVWGSSTYLLLFRCNSLGTIEAAWRLLASQELVVYRGTTEIVRSAPLPYFQQDQWVYFEFWWKQADSGGRWVVKVNGETVIDFTGDTKSEDVTTRPVEAWYIQAIQNNCNVDDVVLNDESGASNNSWPGQVRLQAVVPNGAGDVTQLTPTAGANWECVDEIPPTGTDYVYSSTVDQYDLYAMGNPVPIGAATIKNVVLQTRAALDAGSGSIANIIKSGTVESQGSDEALTEAWRPIRTVWPTNPDGGGAWTWATIDALQAGLKVR